MPKPLTENTLFYGDNLPILREHLSAERVDLIYLYKEQCEKDTATQVTFEDLCLNAPAPVQKLLQTFADLLGANQMTAYLLLLTPLLLELHRVLKPTGSLYLHCDPTTSHYLKLILDTIFGAKNFRNERSIGKPMRSFCFTPNLKLILSTSSTSNYQKVRRSFTQRKMHEGSIGLSRYSLAGKGLGKQVNRGAG
jgi:site-specific DNA-methyltransferase (adenine-specific)